MFLIQEGNIEGVNKENPANSKIFDAPTNKHCTDDISLLAKHWLAQNCDAAASANTVNFFGFADIFQAPNAPSVGHDVAAHLPHHHDPPPPMKT